MSFHLFSSVILILQGVRDKPEEDMFFSFFGLSTLLILGASSDQSKTCSIILKLIFKVPIMFKKERIIFT